MSDLTEKVPETTQNGFDDQEVGKKRTSSVLDVDDNKDQESSKFGSRLLTEENDVFAHNAWYAIANNLLLFYSSRAKD